MTDNDPCSHLDRGQLEVVLPLDDYLGITEAVVRCSTCSWRAPLVDLLIAIFDEPYNRGQRPLLQGAPL